MSALLSACLRALRRIRFLYICLSPQAEKYVRFKVLPILHLGNCSRAGERVLCNVDGHCQKGFGSFMHPCQQASPVLVCLPLPACAASTVAGQNSTCKVPRQACCLASALHNSPIFYCFGSNCCFMFLQHLQDSAGEVHRPVPGPLCSPMSCCSRGQVRRCRAQRQFGYLMAKRQLDNFSAAINKC